ncbi:MAG: S1C family serine protease, partial [Bacillota bacterium]|nr:S1C family serine protease [Bacillota bacterium]
LTNFHVIQDGYRVVAYNNDGKAIAINGVVKYDQDTDLALLGTSEDLTLPSLKIGNIDYLEKGDPIVTIGSPEGLVNTVSTGIISNLHKMDDNGKTVNMIQITAPITHGSSGGALFNEYGEVIGVTSSGFESGNLNFAVGINHAETWIQAYGNMSASKLPFIPYESLPSSSGNETVTEPPATPAEPEPKGPFPISTDKLVLGANLRDVVMNPDKPILYGLSDDKDIIEINLETKQTRKITLNLTPERIFFANNELYVTLPKGKHDSYWMLENQEGAFAVINADTMTLVDQVDITMDPLDIVADSESIYLSGASGQLTDLKVFSRKTLLETESVTRVAEGLFLEMDPEGKRVYGLNTGISPRSIEAFQFKDGKSAGHYETSGYAQYELEKNMNISPDGKYLFNGSGVVSSTSLSYMATLPQSYEEIAFDVKNNRFYTSSKKGLEVYDYSTFAKLKHYDLQHGIDQMFVQDNQLVVVYKDTTGTLPKQAIKKYPISADGLLTMPPADAPPADPSAEPEQFVPVSAATVSLPKIPVTTDKTILPVEVKKEILNPLKPILYGISTSGKDVVEYNLSTKQTRKITFDYPPNKLFFANNELYVALKTQTNYNYGQPSVGAFAIVDADSFTVKKQLDIALDPADIVADASSIYITDGGANSWTTLKAYSRSTYEETGSFSFVPSNSALAIHPDGGKIYSMDIRNSPADIQMYQFTDGKNTTTYDSPYHGEYPFFLNMKVSPDGKYIFNGSGVVLQTGSQRGEDMKYVTRLYNPFEEIDFDLSRNRVYTSSKKGLDIYDYSTLERIKHYELPHEIDYMAIQDNNLIVTYREAATGILPKKTIEKYPLTEDGVLTMQDQ